MTELNEKLTIEPSPATPAYNGGDQKHKSVSGTKKQNRFAGVSGKAQKNAQLAAQVVQDVRNMEIRYKKNVDRLFVLMRMTNTYTALVNDRRLTEDDLAFVEAMAGTKSTKGGAGSL